MIGDAVGGHFLEVERVGLADVWTLRCLCRTAKIVVPKPSQARFREALDGVVPWAEGRGQVIQCDPIVVGAETLMDAFHDLYVMDVESSQGVENSTADIAKDSTTGTDADTEAKVREPSTS